MRVGIISDTHGKLHPAALELFAGVTHIIHAGDVGSPGILDALAAVAPLTAVAGNIDGFRCGDAGEEARVELGGLKIYVTHILDRPRGPRPEVRRALQGEPADLVVFGHSHLPHNEMVEGRWFFNPASAGPRRFDYPTSIGFLEKTDAGWRGWHQPLDARSEPALEKYMNHLSRG